MAPCLFGSDKIQAMEVEQEEADMQAAILASETQRSPEEERLSAAMTASLKDQEARDAKKVAFDQLLADQALIRNQGNSLS
jgi:hypothetical protein